MSAKDRELTGLPVTTAVMGTTEVDLVESYACILSAGSSN